MTQEEIDSGLKPYNHQDAYTLANIGATWTSANDMWSVTGYIRNAFDEEYKTGVALSTSGDSSVTPGDPRTFGVMVNFKY